MEKLDLRIPIQTPHDIVYFHQLGDVHREALGCDAAKWRRDIAAIAEANAKGGRHYWWGHGDMVNAITRRDLRHDAAAVAPEFRKYEGKSLHQAAVRVLAKELSPIADCCLGIMAGNHELKIAKEHEYNPAEDLAERLDVPYLGYSAVIRVSLILRGLAREVFILYAHHGRGAARTLGAKINMVYAMRDLCDADVYAIGHVHELLSFVKVYTAFTRRGPLQHFAREQLFLVGGTYLKSYPSEGSAQRPRLGAKSEGTGYDPDRVARTDYAEVVAYPPAVMGHWGFSARVRHSSHRPQHGQRAWLLQLRLVDFR